MKVSDSAVAPESGAAALVAHASRMPRGVALIGLGNVARIHVRALADLADLTRIIGVHARDPVQRERFAERHGFVAADSAEALIADPDTAVVLLLTPPSARLGLLEQAIHHGKPVLMEKPLARTTAEALQLIESAERAGLPFGVVLQHRKRAGAKALKALLDSGELGEVGLVRLIVPWWREQAYYDTAGRGTKARDGGGVLLSQAIHALDLMLHLLGPVRRVAGFAATSRLHRMETEDTATAGFEFASGALGFLLATTAAYPGGSEVLTVDAQRATVELGNSELIVRWRDGRVDRFPDSIGSGTGADPMAFDHGMHREVIGEFLNAVAEGRPVPVPARAALRVHHFIDALLRSSDEGRHLLLDPETGAAV